MKKKNYEPKYHKPEPNTKIKKKLKKTFVSRQQQNYDDTTSLSGGISVRGKCNSVLLWFCRMEFIVVIKVRFPGTCGQRII